MNYIINQLSMQMKRKLLFAALCAVAALGQLRAQTDVTSTYLTNADFSQTTPLTDTYLYGYGKDGSPYGFQAIDGWTSVVTSGDDSNSSYPNSGMAGGVFSYGSSTQLKGNAKAAPATNPNGEASGNCFGFFGVWGCGGYYYQSVTLAAGKYTITVPMYNQSGTQANTTYTGFFPTSGTNQTVAVNPTVGQWVNQTVTFTLADETAGQIRIGYQSTGSGSGANPMLFIDCVKIEYTAVVIKDALESAIEYATRVYNASSDATLSSALTDAQAVYDNDSSTQDQVNAAVETLNAAVADCIATLDDLTFLIKDADFSATTGWTPVVSESYKDYGNGLIGTSLASYAPSTTDANHLNTEYYLAVQCRWSSNYSSFTQTIPSLPAGHYTLVYDVENSNSSTTKATYENRFKVSIGSTVHTDNKTEWMNGASDWTNHSISFTLEETSDITISLGYGMGSNNFASANTPVLYISKLGLSYQSFEAAWTTAKDAAQAVLDDAAYNNITGAERTAVTTAKAATPSTLEEYSAAITALEGATDAFIAAKDSYDAYVTSKAASEGVNEADVLAVVIAGNANATAADALAASIILPRAFANKAATAMNPVQTDYVVNGTFDNNVEGWQHTANVWSNNIASNQQGAFNVPFYENWDGSAQVNKMYQTIDNIPNGTYRLDIAAFVNTLANPNESQYVFANNDKTYLTTGEPTAYEVYTVVTNNQIEVGLDQTTATANWMGIDNVSLRYYGAGDVINDAKNAAHKLAWQEAKAAAEAAVANSDYANVTGSEKSDLEAEIAKAEPSTAEGYDEAAAALTTATSTFTAAKGVYDAYAEIRGIAVALGVTPGDAPANAAAASAATHALNVAVYTATTADNIFDVTDVYAPSWSDMSTSSGQHWSGDTSISYADNWSSGTNTTERTATITLPAGEFILMSAGRGSENTVTTMSANGTFVTFASNGDMGLGINKAGAASFDATDAEGFANKSGAAENSGTGWEWRYIPVTLSAETEITVIQKLTRLSGSAWGSFCDFKILKKGVVADADDYAALNSAIETAEAKTLGFEDGQYAPYNNVAALETLAAAKAFDQTAKNEKETVEAVTNTLTVVTWTANEGDVDAIYNGHFAEANGTNPKGWTRSNGAWGQQITGLDASTGAETSTAWYYNTEGAWEYGKDGVYTLPLAANQAYKLTFKYRSHAWGSNNYMKASVLNSVTQGLADVTYAQNVDNTKFVTATAYFTTGDAGDYILSLTQSGNTHLTDVSLVKVASAALTLDDATTYDATDRTYYETVGMTRNVVAGFNTVCLPFDLTAEQVANTFGDLATVYEFSENSDDPHDVTVNFNTKNENTIEANVPVLVGNASASTDPKLFTNVMLKTGEAKVAGKNFDFVGTYDAATTIAAGDYFISNGALYRSEGSTTINAFRAYLKTTTSGGSVKLFIDGIETGIDAISGISSNPSQSIYNLAGQRMSKVQKGLNIVNGNKVLVK